VDQLGDAIREHLELKRRRGGDPDEIAAQERDALGSTRREPESAEEPEADLEPETDLEPEAAEPPAIGRDPDQM